MIKRASIFFLFLAVSIFLLHSLTPHHHQDTNPDCRLSHQASLISGLIKAFCLDPGAGHLEQLVEASRESYSFSPNAIPFPPCLPASVSLLSLTETFGSNFLIPKIPHPGPKWFPGIPFRGPPSC